MAFSDERRRNETPKTQAVRPGVFNATSHRLKLHTARFKDPTDTAPLAT
jgi:hypothetical protein